MDTSTEEPLDPGKGISEKTPSPTPPTPVSETRKTPNKQPQPQPHPVSAKSPKLTPSALHQKKLYIRGVPKQTDILEVKQMLQNISASYMVTYLNHTSLSQVPVGNTLKYILR